ncbi:hypothetical protein [Flavobacterium pedocola]
MKANKILVGLLLALTLLSCKKEEKVEEKTEVATEQLAANPNIFSVTLNATVKKDDSFQIYYKNDDAASYEEKNSFFIEFKGSDKPQDIVFKLPEDVLPNYLRLDFGTNKEQPEIVVNSFKIDYLGKTFEAKGTDFFKYLTVNELTMKKDTAKSSVTPIITKEGTYDPITYSGKELYDQIQLLIK